MGFELLHPRNDRDKWMRVIQKLPRELQDVHWTPEYMATEELRGHAPRLATYVYDEYVVTQPIIVRDVLPAKVETANAGICEVGTGFRDMSSPYGYGGPASNHGQRLYEWFNYSLTSWAIENRIVTEFCALHPFMVAHQTELLKTDQSIKPIVRKQVVWIDLTTNFRDGYHSGRRQGVRKATKSGMITIQMANNPDDFINLYRQTMLRKKAAERWYFPEEYLRMLCAIGTTWCAVAADSVRSAALMLMTNDGTAYYHLAANALDDYPRTAANDLLLDEMAKFAASRGCKRFHLGGGATSNQDDGVLFFKSGFSDLRAPAMSYFRVFDEKAYAVLCAEKKRREMIETGTEFNTNFEPLYRREAS